MRKSHEIRLTAIYSSGYIDPRSKTHPANMSDQCQRAIQTDRHGHPPIGVSWCPVGEIGVGVGACGVVNRALRSLQCTEPFQMEYLDFPQFRLNGHQQFRG